MGVTLIGQWHIDVSCHHLLFFLLAVSKISDLGHCPSPIDRSLTNNPARRRYSATVCRPYRGSIACFIIYWGGWPATNARPLANATTIAKSVLKRSDHSDNQVSWSIATRGSYTIFPVLSFPTCSLSRKSELAPKSLLDANPRRDSNEKRRRKWDPSIRSKNSQDFVDSPFREGNVKDFKIRHVWILEISNERSTRVNKKIVENRLFIKYNRFVYFRLNT